MKSSLLIVLAVGFAGFGALEVAALNPEDVRDRVAETPDHEKAKTDETAAPAHTPPIMSADDRTCLTPALVAAFEPRHQDLMARESRLDLRQAELEDLETTIEARLAGMAETQDRLQTMTERLDVIAGEDISHLVDMYTTMKPKSAAAIFDRMDPAFAAGFLREIESARAGVIMAEMGEEQSYRVSLLIANRHAEWRNGR